ncbi:glycosyltransferase family 2 protein [Aquimarina sp. AU474]|uniref:glycosyltransferase family 2 protein n=1 Tax=Aquimarina sp. AU474 TaxID=2108529 RepID=UPI000D68C7CD
MKLSIVIVSFNVRYFLEQCVLSLKAATLPINSEIIVVDNNSTDDSCKMIKDDFPDIILIENKINEGFSKANNQGVAVAKGLYVCFLNPDTIIAADTFIRLLNQAKELPNVGLLGPRLISGTGNFLEESKRNIPSPLTSFRRFFRLNLGNVKSYYAYHIPDTGIGDVDVLVGAFILVKKELFDSVGGFDEDYFIYGEDIDLSYKIKKKGLQNYYIGNIVAVHYRGESTDRNAIFVRRFYTGMRLFYKKHFKSNIVLDIIISAGIRFISMIQSFKNFSKEKRKINAYYLITENETLYRQITKIGLPDVKMITTIRKEDLGDKNIEIIFDNDFMTFDEIIEQMQFLKKKNVSFKIRPKKCNYIIGSNFSDGKGEVLMF